MARPNQAELDLGALRHNVSVARQLAPHSKMLAVVKANAYGHGAPIIATALQSQVDALGVACLEEALELRDCGVTSPVLLLEGVFEETEISTAAQLGLWVTIGNEQQLKWLDFEIFKERIQVINLKKKHEQYIQFEIKFNIHYLYFKD